MSVQFINNTDSVMFDFGMACIRALERCGSEAEGYAVDLAPRITPAHAGKGEFGLYRWDEKTEDAVVKDNDHAMDDIRYFAYTVMRKKVGKEPYKSVLD